MSLSIIEAIDDPALFGPWFKGKSWRAWRVFLKTLFALDMTPAELALYRECTGREKLPTVPFKEGWLVCGRRSGKSRIMALIGAYLAAFHDYDQYLAPGERGLIPVIAADREQAGVILRYLKAFFEVPLLKPLVVNDVADGLELSNRVTIRVTTNSTRRSRGYTILACACDEVAFWRDENSSEPDKEVLAAIRPGMVTIPTSMLICGSSPHARRGILLSTYQRYFGRDDDRVLVWQAPTLTMNPSVDAALIEEARIADPASAAAEYDAQFRSDVEEFVRREAIEACTSRGVFARAPGSGVTYTAFADPSGGSSDAMTLAISHLDKDGVAVLDATLTRKPPFSPEAVCAEFSLFLKKFNITTLHGDHFAGQWPVEQFKKHGIDYKQSGRPKRDLYLSVLPLINSMKVDFLDDPRIIAEFTALERRQARGGREVVDHVLNGHDDLVNSISGALVIAAEKGARLSASILYAACASVGPSWAVNPGIDSGGAMASEGGGITLSNMPNTSTFRSDDYDGGPSGSAWPGV